MSDPLDELLVDLVCKQLDDLDAGRRDGTDLAGIAAAAGVSEMRVSEVVAWAVNDRLKSRKPPRRRPDHQANGGPPNQMTRRARPIPAAPRPATTKAPAAPKPPTEEPSQMTTVALDGPVAVGEEWELAAHHPSPRIRAAHLNVLELIDKLNDSKAELVRMIAADRELAVVRSRIAVLQAELEQLTARLPDDEAPAPALKHPRAIVTCPGCGKAMGANNLGRHRARCGKGDPA